MSPKWLEAAADLLDQAADTFSNHGCNDWDPPASWSMEDRREFGRAFAEWNGDPQDFDPDHPDVGDWAAMRFLAEKFREEAGGPCPS
jgi:hypothetical protein